MVITSKIEDIDCKVKKMSGKIGKVSDEGSEVKGINSSYKKRQCSYKRRQFNTVIYTVVVCNTLVRSYMGCKMKNVYSNYGRQ